jgi:triosephosphate isomerase
MEKIFAANWKLNHSPVQTKEFFELWNKIRKARSGEKFVFFPSAFSLATCAEMLGGTGDEWGPQNCYFEEKGAFTGENSMGVAKELGCKWVLVGHSERRQIFGEGNESFAKKIAKAQGLGLTPLYCIGELLSDRESGKTLDVLKAQLVEGLKLADAGKPLVIAYEPVWAIGTGKVAGPAQVQEVHAFLAGALSEMGFGANAIPLLYGGSVKPDNAGELIRIPHVHGFLVGGASLDVGQFLKIAGQG